jgi:hypothetical protein
MKKEYDFSKGEKGKFYKKQAKLNIPVYLDQKARKFVEKIAKRKKTDMSTVVNDLIKTDMKIADYIE